MSNAYLRLLRHWIPPPEILLTYHLIRIEPTETSLPDAVDPLKIILVEKEALLQKQSDELTQLRQQIQYLRKPDQTDTGNLA